MEIMIDGEWINLTEIHRKTVEAAIDGRQWIPAKADWSLTYWIIQFLRVGF